MPKPKMMPMMDDVSNAEKLRPSFLIIGGQKCGTTALFDYLSLHPQIAAPSEKEINYFLCSSRHARGDAFYHSFFPDCNEDTTVKLTFEASANYLAGPGAAERIRQYDRDMKLIVLLRDPVDRAYSAWQMYQRFYAKTRTWYFDWMSQCQQDFDASTYVRRNQDFGKNLCVDIRQELDARANGKPIEAPFIRHGFYAEQIQSFLKFFPRGQLLILESSDFRKKTYETMREVEDFLGIANHTWTDETLEPVLVGGYADKISNEAAAVLSEVYGDRNQELFQLLGQTYSWQAAGLPKPTPTIRK